MSCNYNIHSLKSINLLLITLFTFLLCLGELWETDEACALLSITTFMLKKKSYSLFTAIKAILQKYKYLVKI